MAQVNVCFVLIVFQADHTLEACLESLQPFGPVVAAEGPVAFWRERGYATSTDRTHAILDAFHVPTVRDLWVEKDNMVRAALRQIPAGTEFVWFVDADEIWAPETIEAILALLAEGNVDSMGFSPYSFYGGFERYMTGFEYHFEWHRINRRGAFLTHRPPTLCAADGRPWREHRHLSNKATAAMGLHFFHYSYVFPSQMRMKAEYYRDRDPRGTIPHYFERVYLPWVKGDEATRAALEQQWQGVHDWLPARRGPCFTQAFEGAHPPAIEKRLPALRARFARELEACV